MPIPIRLVIADDHPMIRSGVRLLVGTSSRIHVVAEATTGDNALHVCQQCQPDVLLLDVHMLGLTTLLLLAALHTLTPRVQVLIFTATNDSATFAALLRTAIAGYLVKDEAIEELCDAIEAVADRATWFSQTVRRFLQYQATTISLR